MKVKLVKTGKVCEYPNGYAARLIEQGKAVKAATEAAKPASARAAKKADAGAAE